MRFKLVVVVVTSLAFLVSACVSGSDDLGLTPASQSARSSYHATNYNPVITGSVSARSSAYPQTIKPPVDARPTNIAVATHSGNGLTDIEPFYGGPYGEPVPIPAPEPPRTRKTYLLNGLASAIPMIGYGFANLSKKIPGSELFSYATPLEGSTVIRSSVLRSIIDEHARDPNIEINLIGISYGANVVTSISRELERKGIPVHYLAFVEGPMPRPVKSNVAKADSFTCTQLGCFQVPLRLASGNTQTQLSKFRIGVAHIPLGNSDQLHDRVLQQIND